jgi:hypothetical protein
MPVTNLSRMNKLLFLHMFVALSTTAAASLAFSQNDTAASAAKTLAERAGQKVSEIDHRAFHFSVSDNEYYQSLRDEARFKKEIEQILDQRAYSASPQVDHDKTPLEKAYSELQREKAKLDVAIAIAEKRARESLLAQPERLERRAREIYATTEAPTTRRALALDFQQILFDVSSRSIDETTARIKAARNALAAGESFDVVAKKYSDDPAVLENGGRILGASATAIDTQIARILFDEIKAGEVSEKIISTRRGLHVIKLLEIRQPIKRPFEEVRAALQVGILEEVTKAARAQILTRYASTPTIYNDSAIDALLIRPDQRALDLARDLSRQGLEASRKSQTPPSNDK